MTRKGKGRKPNGSSQAHGSVSVTVQATADFFEAANHAESGLKHCPEEAGKHSCELEAWRTRDKLLAWFAKGVQADATARLTFSPGLTKQQRQDLHRLCTESATQLQTKSIGLGDARCLVVAHPEADLGAEDTALSDEQAAVADALYRDLKAAGDVISRDEVRTRVVVGELTEKMQLLMKQSREDQGALRKVAAAIEAGNESALLDALATSKRAVQSGAPARGSGVLPLQLAVECGNEAAVRALLDAGAPLDQQDGSGRTALQVARKAEECDIEGLLLQRGAKDGEQAAWGADAAQFSAEKGGDKAERASAAAAAAAAALERPGAPKVPSRDTTPRAGQRGGAAFSEQHGGTNGAAGLKGGAPASAAADSAPPAGADTEPAAAADGASDGVVVPGATFADALKTGDAAQAAAQKGADHQGEADSGAADSHAGGTAMDSTIVRGATFADAVATGDAQQAAEQKRGSSDGPADGTVLPGVSFAAAVETGDASKAAKHKSDGNNEPGDSSVVPGVSFADAVATGDAGQAAADKGLNVAAADPEEFPTMAEAMGADDADPEAAPARAQAAAADDSAARAEPQVDPEEFPTIAEAEDDEGSATEKGTPERPAEAPQDEQEPASYAAMASKAPASDSAVVEGAPPTAAPVEFSKGRVASQETAAGKPDAEPSPESAMANEPLPGETVADGADEGLSDAGGANTKHSGTERPSEIQPAERTAEEAAGTSADAYNGAGDAESVPAVLQSLVEEYYDKACALYEEHGLLFVGGVVAAVGLLAFGAAMSRRR